MKSSIVGLIKQAKRPRDIKFRNQLYVFLMCLGISVFIWFFIKLSQEYVTNVNFSVIYTNLPQNKVISDNPDNEIKLNIKSKGIDLFTLKYLTLRNPVNIDFRYIHIRKNTENDFNYILTNQLRQQVISQLDPSDHLLDIKPDTLFFKLENVISKQLKIIPNLILEFKKQYLLYDSVNVDPPYITIKGPVSMIDTLTRVYTKKKVLSNLNKNISVTLKIDKPLMNKKVNYSSEKVDVFIPVEKFTEATIQLPIDILSDNPDLKIKTFPEKISVTYIVAIKDYQRVDPKMFRLISELPQIRNGKQKKLKVNISQFPPFIKIIKIEPVEADYIILK